MERNAKNLKELSANYTTDKTHFLSYKQRLTQQKRLASFYFNHNLPISDVLLTYTESIDGFISDLCRDLDMISQDIVLIAVGGYGRKELFPHADIDLFILTKNQRTSSNNAQELIAELWNYQLKIGHKFCTFEQAIEEAHKDITFFTSLLDARFILGSSSLFAQFMTTIKELNPWPRKKFIQHRQAQQKKRHQTYGAYDLEPNIKYSAGGIRDIQEIQWLITYVNIYHCSSQVILTIEEQKELETCLHFFWAIRFSLHDLSKRAENRLLFDFQTDVAHQLNFIDQKLMASELLMKRYYRSVRRVTELNQMLFEFHKTSPLAHPLELTFSMTPESLLNFFLDIAKQPTTKISSSLLRTIRAFRREHNQPLCNNKQCRQIWMDILKQPYAIDALSLMHQHRVLSLYLPPWAHIEGQMQFDLFHAYTVDEHTHQLLLHIKKLESAPDNNLITQTLKSLPQKSTLLIAAIFHDIAKGQGGNHSILGEKEALIFCQTHGISDKQTQDICFLVKHHLFMSKTAFKKDLHDPETIQHFTDIIKNTTRLDYLFCLTVADIKATNPNLWTAWKQNLLEQLYQASSSIMSSKTSNVPSILSNIKAKKLHVLTHASTAQYPYIKQLWAQFKAEYFWLNSYQQIAWHTQTLLHQDKRSPCCFLSNDVLQGSTEFFVFCDYNVKLFSRLACIFESQRLNICQATLCKTIDGFALQSFSLNDHQGQPLLEQQRLDTLQKSVRQLLKCDFPKLPKKRNLSRKLKNFKVATSVHFTKHRKNSTQLELISLDKPGLLMHVGVIFEQLAIHLISAKVTTVGERAEDYFILQNEEYSALTEKQQNKLKQQLIQLLEH